MGWLVAIEGIDGSGKGTQAKKLHDRLRASGRQVALLGFPRYEATLFGRAIGEFLNGRFGTLSQVHPFLASLLYAGDRFESRKTLDDALAQNEIVVLDRYVSSNLAHQGAKLQGEERAQLLRTIGEIEFGVYGLPRADLNILLDLPAATAQRLIARKESRTYTDQPADLQEADAAYLAEVRALYRQLAETESNWTTVHCETGGTLKSIEAISDELLAIVLQRSATGV